MLVYPRPCSRRKSGNGSLGLDEPPSKVDFELCNLVPSRSDSCKDVAGQQTQREPVRVVKQYRIINGQA
jgi:hypothetical protein